MPSAPRLASFFSSAGVGAPVVAYCPEDSLLVLGYIDGRTYGNADVAKPANIGPAGAGA